MTTSFYLSSSLRSEDYSDFSLTLQVSKYDCLWWGLGLFPKHFCSCYIFLYMGQFRRTTFKWRIKILGQIRKMCTRKSRTSFRLSFINTSERNYTQEFRGEIFQWVPSCQEVKIKDSFHHKWKRLVKSLFAHMQFKIVIHHLKKRITGIWQCLQEILSYPQQHKWKLTV